MTALNLPPADPNTLRLIIRDEVARLIESHEDRCPFHAEAYPRRIRAMELSQAKLLGVLAGSAAFGGGIGSLLAKLL